MHKKSSKILASLAAFAMVAPTAVGFVAPLSASAEIEVCGESDFDYKALPWHTCESSPAKQNFAIEDGAFHITILNATGPEQQWDLQFRHRNLDFKSGHTYKISFKAKSSHNGLKLNSKIGQPNSPYEEYCDLVETEFVNGPHMGNSSGWGKPASLSTEWKTFEGTFECSKDLEGMEWAFHFAAGEKGNAQDGDELWFDDMHIVCQKCSTTKKDGGCGADTDEHYGAISRSYSGLKNNYISVNQIGYLTDYAKIATLGDNGGDIMHGAETISLSGSYDFELVSSSGTVAYTGKTTTVKHDAQSDDDTCKLDFSEFKTPGKYYLRIKGKEWRSFEFEIGDDIYSKKGENSKGDLLTNSINYFYQNRSGLDIKMDYITSGTEAELAHQGGHKTDTASVQKLWKNEYTSKEQATGTYASSTITANGGWYDAGDHGKYVVNGGISVWTLQNMYERALKYENDKGKKKFADGSGTVVIPEASNGNPDILDECKYELDFMDQMVVKSSEPTWGDKAGMVYHKLHDHKWTGLATRPWNYDGSKEEGGWETVRIVKPPTFAATLNYAACAAQAARLWKDYDSSYSAKLLEAAKTCYKAAQDNFYEADHSKTTHPDLNCPCEKEEINEKSLYAPMWQAKGGGPYGDNEVKDDFYWAACELFISCSRLGDSAASTYKSDLDGYSKTLKVTTRITGGENANGEGSFTSYNWGNTGSCGSIALLLNMDLLSSSEKSTLKQSVLDAAEDYLDCEDAEGYCIPYKYDGKDGYNDPNNLDPSIIIYGYEWGSNSMVINNLSVMALAYDLTAEKKYMDGVVTGMNYLLGNNPLSFSYITGYGTYHEKNPHHRYWSHELDKTLPHAPDGILSGGPNAGLQDPYVRALGFVPGKKTNPSQRCFVDSIEAWSTNEVTINWNAPLAWITEYLQDGRVDLDDDTPITTETTTTTTSSSTSDDKPFYGDVDCSGDVKIADAVLLARYIAEDPVTVTAQGKVNADCYKGGGITSEDLASLLKYLAGVTKTLPEG